MNRISKHAKTLRDAVDNGDDPMTAELNDTAAQGGKPKPSGTQQHCRVFILSFSAHKHKVHPFLIFTDAAKAISAGFGGDCTMSAIENRFRRIKSDAKLINKALAHGIDPFSLPIGGEDGSTSKPSMRAKNSDSGQKARFFLLLHSFMIF